VQETIFQVKSQQVANLAGTRVYCKSGIDDASKARAFLCSTSGRNGAPAQGSYAIALSQKGVEVDRIVSTDGDARLVKWFRTLALESSTVRDKVFEVGTTGIAQLAGTPIVCGSQLTKGVRTFGCAIGDPATGKARPRTHSVLINERGVTVIRIDLNGKTVTQLGEWRNP
jgi:hypothetical protein